MGNSLSYQSVQSSNEQENVKMMSIDKNNLVDVVDEIAIDFILKQNMLDIIRFSDKSYYDNLIILTSSILKSQLTDLELGILKDRVLNTINHNSNNINNSEVAKNANVNNEQIYFTTANDLKTITLSNEKEKKKALEIISKFYIKIMTIFSVITSVMDPQYVYEDDEGTRKYFQLKDFDSYKMLNKDTKNLQLHQLYNPMGLVHKRLTILKNKINTSESNSENIVMNPGEKLCEISKIQNPGSLINEIGMKELDLLYYDVFDYESGTWSKRSDKMQKKYDKDVTKFFHIFTGKTQKPSNVRSFADIEMLQFHKLHRCQNKDFYQDIVVNKSDALFVKYMKKIDTIEEKVMIYKKKLITILKEIFVVMQKGDSANIMINPEITLKDILKLQEQTQDCILNIYKSCESNFLEALLIYEDIYDRKYGMVNIERVSMMQNNNMNNYQAQINNLDSVPIAAPVVSPSVQNSTPLNASSLNPITNNTPILPEQTISHEQDSSDVIQHQTYVQSPNSVKINNTPQINQTPVIMKKFVPTPTQQTQIVAPMTPDILKPSVPLNNLTQQKLENTFTTPNLNREIASNIENGDENLNREIASNIEDESVNPEISLSVNTNEPSNNLNSPIKNKEEENSRGIFSFLNFTRKSNKDKEESQNNVLDESENRNTQNSEVDQTPTNNPIIASTMHTNEMEKLNSTAISVEDEKKEMEDMMNAVNSVSDPTPQPLNVSKEQNTLVENKSEPLSTSTNIEQQSSVEPQISVIQNQQVQTPIIPKFAPSPIKQEGGNIREQMKQDILKILG
jgi:hypothetical protein